MILDIDDRTRDFTLTAPEYAAARPSRIRWLPRSLLRRLQALRRNQRRRAITRFFERMSDHTLRDIGFERGEIRMAASDLSARLASSRRQR